MSTKFIYCFIRKDLPVVHQIIQMAHATFEAGTKNPKETETPNICLFQVENQMELLEVSNYLRKEGIDFTLYQEPDFDDDFTSICTQIIKNPKRRAKFANFKMFRVE